MVFFFIINVHQLLEYRKLNS